VSGQLVASMAQLHALVGRELPPTAWLDVTQAMVDAFWFVQSVRLRNQHAVERSGVGAANRVDPDRLNELDRYILKAAFRQARKLQQHIRADYQL